MLGRDKQENKQLSSYKERLEELQGCKDEGVEEIFGKAMELAMLEVMSWITPGGFSTDTMYGGTQETKELFKQAVALAEEKIRPSYSHGVEIEVKYFSDKIPSLDFIQGKSDWVDLYTAEEVVLKEGQSRLIPLGVGIKLPEGNEAILAPRSSTFKNYGILQTNSVGVIDQSYCGDNDQWMMPVYATRDITIPECVRIAQFRILHNQYRLFFKTVEHLGDTDRGGFGSTGR